MTLEGRHIWLATRGGDRAISYQSELVAALVAAGATSVEVVGVEGLVRSTAAELGERASGWLSSTAGRLAHGLRLDRLLGERDLADEDDAGSDAGGDDAASPGLDLVVVDDPRLLQALRVTPTYRRHRPLTVALVDDYTVDTRWRGAALDALIVPHEGLARAYRSGETADVVVAGPPLSTAYRTETELGAAKAALGLSAEQPVVLVVAEQWRLDVLDRAVFQLTLIDSKPVVLFHYGSSDERAQVLREASTGYGLRAQMFGDVEGLAEIYAAADALLLPAEAPNAVDLLLARRPVVLVGPDRGSARAAFLGDQGAVLHVEDVVELGTHLEALLEGHAGDAFVTVADGLATSANNAAVATALGTLYAAHQARRAAPPEAPTEPTGAPEGPVIATPLVQGPAGSPFEAIGSASRSAKEGALGPPITAAEAKDQMASLILKEREAERNLSEAVKDRDRWLARLELAKEYDDQDLVAIASERLRVTSAQVARANGQIEMVRRGKDKLRARVEGDRGGAPRSRQGTGAEPRPASGSADTSAVEERFRKMEIERDLSRLRRRIDEKD